MSEPIQITNTEEWNALSPGQEYIDPNGVSRIKSAPQQESPAGGIIQITNTEEWNSISPGQEYIDPNGVKRTKSGVPLTRKTMGPEDSDVSPLDMPAQMRPFEERQEEAVKAIADQEIKETEKLETSNIDLIESSMEERDKAIDQLASESGKTRDQVLEETIIPAMIQGLREDNDGRTTLLGGLLDTFGAEAAEALFTIGDYASYVPAGTQDAIEVVLQDFKESYPETFKDLDVRKESEKAVGELGGILEISEFLTAGIPTVTSGAISATAGATRRAATRAVDATLPSFTREKLEDTSRIDPTRAMFATKEAREAREKLAKETAEQNKELRDRMIREFETQKDVEISDEVDGLKVINPDKVREVGLETLQTLDDTRVSGIAGGNIDEFLSPMMDPDKMDALVSAASEFKKIKPEAFDNNKTVIQNLFEYTVTKEFDPEKGGMDDVLDILNKYGLDFEDYMLSVYGSGSEAGRLLQKLSQIKRQRPLNKVEEENYQKAIDATNDFHKGILRFENIRRGGLVSQIATAARNLTSVGIRNPLESLGNIMDTALYKAGTGKNLNLDDIRYAFRNTSRMFQDPQSVKAFTDLILDNKLVAENKTSLFDNINEIRKLQGFKGDGKVTKSVNDFILEPLEDGVDTLNTFNRLQEHFTRRSVFMGELERLVKNEYDIDLIKAVNEGKLNDLLADASTVRPQGASSFIDLVGRATNKALDVTYAKQPDIPVFRDAARFITKSGIGTMFMPFPRFMFNQIELIMQYGAGSAYPVLKRLMGGSGKLTEFDRKAVSRNVIGLGAMYGAYEYYMSDEAPVDSRNIPISEDEVVDVGILSPDVTGFLFLGNVMSHIDKGDFWEWWSDKGLSEFTDTFVGVNFRNAMGSDILQSIQNLTGTSVSQGNASASRRAGQALGNYVSTLFVPYNQIIDLQRAAGIRPRDPREMRESTTLESGSSFSEGFKRPLRKYFMTPEEEMQLPPKEYIDKQTKEKDPSDILLKVFGGISISQRQSEAAEYIEKLNIPTWTLVSNNPDLSISNEQKRIMRSIIPAVVESAKIKEKNLRERYKEANEAVKEQYTETSYISKHLRNYISTATKKYLKAIVKDKELLSEDPAYAESVSRYNGLSNKLKELAILKFTEVQNRAPDLGDASDVYTLYVYGRSLDN